MKNYEVKERVFLGLYLFVLIGIFFAEKSYASSNFSGDWVKIGEDWFFYQGPNEPLENEWLVYNGDSYYIGSGGKMATGKFIDPEDKAEYFFDRDGRLLEEGYTSDGKLYIGKNGKELRYFNDYRAFLRRELESLREKDFGKKVEKESGSGESSVKSLEGEVIHPKAFALLDINGDGYKDIFLLRDKVGEETKMSPAILSVIVYQEKMLITKESREQSKLKTENEKLPIKERSTTVLMEEEANGAYSTVLRKDRLSGEAVLYRSNGAEDISLFSYHKEEGLSHIYSLSGKRDRFGNPEYYSFSDRLDFQEYQRIFLEIEDRFKEPYPLKAFNLDAEGLTEGLKDFNREELSFFQSQEFND